MGTQLKERSSYTCREFKLDLVINGKAYNDYFFQTATIIPGVGEPTTEEINGNNEDYTYIKTRGSYNNFSFTTSFTEDAIDFQTAAYQNYDFSATLTGLSGSVFENSTFYVSGQVLSFDDVSIGTDFPTINFTGKTDTFVFNKNA